MAYIDTMCFEWRDDIKLSKINRHIWQKKKEIQNIYMYICIYMKIKTIKLSVKNKDL